MPFDEGLGLDHDQGVAPVEEPRQDYHRQAGRAGNSFWSRFSFLEQRRLVAQEEILRGQCRTGGKQQSKEMEQFAFQGVPY